MVKRNLKINIAGRVKKVKTDNFLVALFEAISNSIHAIEDTKKSGNITIEILRNPRQDTLAAIEEKPITGFVITDDGIGFDESNMNSFDEADSELKITRGGKGVGRFSLLKFFEKVEISSVFFAQKYFRRNFLFTSMGIDELEDPVELKDGVTLKTVVTISPIYINYESKSRKNLDDIMIALVEHFIAYLVTDALPNVQIKDGAASKDLKSFYAVSIGKNATRNVFNIGKYEFVTTGIKNFLGHTKHSVYLCGNKRVADRIALSTLDDFFSKKFTDENLTSFAYNIFVESVYLDHIVNDDRDGFRFPENCSLESSSDSAIFKAQILKNVLDIVKENLSSDINKKRQENLKAVEAFVSEIAPQYRYVLKDNKNEIENIHETDPLKIDLALRKIQYEEEVKTKIEVSELLKRAEENTESSKQHWKEKSKDLFSKLSESGKANLAGYIVHRKIILELLRKKMEIEGDLFAREEAIHELIFPMRTTSDEVSYENQNLWILDERLSYHHYLASDKPLKTIPPAESDSRKEPDIIVFNRPIALIDRPESEKIESIVIVEFKRPGDSAVSGDKNPVDQVQEYIELIQEGKAKNRSGRPIQAGPSTHFFCYIICELDSNLKKVLQRKTMKITPDERGMFGYFEDHRAYIEVISYDKMLDDAFKRNRILFEKLQMPPV